MSFKDLISLYKEHWRILPAEVVVSFLRIVDNLDEENSCFLNELVVSVIDMIDPATAQTIMLRKRIIKGSPVGKFVRLVMLSVRKMTYPQISYCYKQLWAYIKKDNLKALHSLLQARVPQMLGKGFQKLYHQQHPYLIKGTPKPGLDSFNELIHSRASRGQTGLGPSLNPLPLRGKGPYYDPAAKAKRRLSFLRSQTATTTTTKPPTTTWIAVKWYGRKIIERTIRTLSSEFYTTGTRRYTPCQISAFIHNIRLNPSSNAMHPQMVRLVQTLQLPRLWPG